MKRRNILISVVLVALCIFILTGCARLNTTIDVKKNGKADISLLYAVIDTSDSSGEQPEEDMKKMEEDGWECTTYNQEGFIGYECTKRNVSLKELADTISGAEADMDFDANSISISRKGFTYTIDWKVFNEEQVDQISAYKRLFDMSDGFMKFTVKLPYKPKNSNATEISEDEKTLTWDLLALGEDQTVHVEFSVFNIILFVLILLVVVVIAAVIIYIFVFRNNDLPISFGKKQNADAGFGKSMPAVSQYSGVNQMHGEINNPSAPLDFEYTRSEANSDLGDISGLNDEFIFCPNCGTKISGSALFCYNCGSSISRDESGMVSHISSGIDNNTHTVRQPQVQPLSVAKSNVSANPRSAFLENRKLIVLSSVGMVIAILLIFVIVRAIQQKTVKRENAINTEVVENADTSDEANDNELESVQIPQITGLSRRPIPGKEYQDVMMGGYSMRIPTESPMDYNARYDENDTYINGFLPHIPDYLIMMFSVRAEYGAPAIYGVTIESSVLGEGKYYADEIAFTDANMYKANYSFVEKFVLNDMEIEHYQVQDSSQTGMNYFGEQFDRQDMYLTINNNEALSVTVSSIASVQGKYSTLRDDLINSLFYTEGGTYDQGVLFVEEGSAMPNIDWSDIDEGTSVLEDIMGTDITTFMNGMNDLGVEIQNTMWEFDQSGNIVEDEEFKSVVEKCESYVEKLKAIQDLKTPTNYMVGIGYAGEELCSNYPHYVAQFLRSVSQYCNVDDLLQVYQNVY